MGTSMAYTPSVRLAGDLNGGYRLLNGIDLTYRYQPLGSAVYQGLTSVGVNFIPTASASRRTSRFPIRMTPDLSTKLWLSASGRSAGTVTLSEAEQELVHGIPVRLCAGH